MLGIDSLLVRMAADVPSLVIMTIVVVVFLRALRSHDDAHQKLTDRLVGLTDQTIRHITMNTEVLRSLNARIDSLQGVRQPPWFVDTIPPKSEQ